MPTRTRNQTRCLMVLLRTRQAAIPTHAAKAKSAALMDTLTSPEATHNSMLDISVPLVTRSILGSSGSRGQK